MDNQVKGICRLGIIPVRAKSNDQAEMVSQLIFGDHYSVNDISSDGRWANITIEYDQYDGWIDIKQHTEISEDYFNHLNNTDFKNVADAVIDGGYGNNVPSTIIDCTGNEFEILREGLGDIDIIM